MYQLAASVAVSWSAERPLPLCWRRYLFDKYGDGRVPWTLRLGFLTTLTAGLGMLPRWVILASLCSRLALTPRAL